MEDDDLAVGRQVDVRLEKIDAEPQRVAIGEQAVLRPEQRATAMGGDHRSGGCTRDRCGKHDDGEEERDAPPHAASTGMSSGRSVMITSTPAATSRSRVAPSFTVNTPTAIPAPCAASTSAWSHSE